MRRLFPDEMGAEASHIAELRRLTRPVDEPTSQGHVVSRVQHERPSSRAGSFAWLGLLAAAGAGVALLSRAADEPPAAPDRASVAAAAPAASVEVGVQVAPAGISGLAIEIDGSITALDAPRKSIKRGLEPVTIKVAAPGFRSVELAVVPDRERSVMVTLVPSAAPVAASASASPVVVPAPRAPAPASSGVIRRYPF